MYTDRKKSRHSVGQEKLDVQALLLSQLPLHIQSFRPTEEPSKHASVIQTTGLASGAKPLALVTQRRRDRDAPSPKDLPISHSSSPKPPSLTPSPKPLSLSSSSKSTPLQTDRLKTSKNYLNETLLNITSCSKLKQVTFSEAQRDRQHGCAYDTCWWGRTSETKLLFKSLRSFNVFWHFEACFCSSRQAAFIWPHILKVKTLKIVKYYNFK